MRFGEAFQVKLLIVCTMIVVVFSPYPSRCEGREVRRVYPEQPQAFSPRSYVTGKLGLFEPNSDSDGLKGFSSGIFVGGNLGYRATPYLAVEGEIDYYDSSFGNEDLWVVPFIFNARLIIPSRNLEPYFQGGAGIYFAEFEFFDGFFLFRDSAAGFGAHVGAGLDINVNPGIVAGLEFRWFYSKPDFSDAFGPDPNVGGFIFNFYLRGLF